MEEKGRRRWEERVKDKEKKVSKYVLSNQLPLWQLELNIPGDLEEAVWNTLQNDLNQRTRSPIFIHQHPFCHWLGTPSRSIMFTDKALSSCKPTCDRKKDLWLVLAITVFSTE